MSAEAVSAAVNEGVEAMHAHMRQLRQPITADRVDYCARVAAGHAVQAYIAAHLVSAQAVTSEPGPAVELNPTEPGPVEIDLGGEGGGAE